MRTSQVISALEKLGLSPHSHYTKLHESVYSKYSGSAINSLEHLGILADLIYWTCADFLGYHIPIRPDVMYRFRNEIEYYKHGYLASGLNKLYVQFVCLLHVREIPSINLSQYVKAEEKYYLKFCQNDG